MTMRLIIDRGRVNCPIRGDVDVDVCAACPNLRAIQEGTDRQVLRCSPPDRTHSMVVPPDAYA